MTFDTTLAAVQLINDTGYPVVLQRNLAVKRVICCVCTKCTCYLINSCTHIHDWIKPDSHNLHTGNTT
jgi:hypothetical protein